MKSFVVFLAICSLVISHSEAESELLEKIKKVGEECKTKVGASDDDVAGLFKYEPASNEKAKCLHACVMKKMGIMDENNKLIESGASDYIKSAAAGNADFEKLSTEVFNECKNTPANSDECEFAETFRNCVIGSSKSKGINILPQ